MVPGASRATWGWGVVGEKTQLCSSSRLSFQTLLHNLFGGGGGGLKGSNKSIVLIKYARRAANVH